MASGCAVAKCGATRSVPATVFPGAAVVPGNATALKIAIRPFSTEATVIKGGHHEGLLQVRQPWIFGLSGEQKQQLYGSLRDVVRYAFIDEFVRQGASVYIPESHLKHVLIPTSRHLATEDKARFFLSGTIRSIELNTYGRGLGGSMEGAGSSGNYWEAEIVFDDVVITDRKTGTEIFRGGFKTYCKLDNCPLKLDWTMTTLLTRSLDSIRGMSAGPLGTVDAVRAFKADYLMEPSEQNPPDIAARLGAMRVMEEIP
jgi:hypothetical protein